uniref:Uncharacterized protein n=1 Tax=Poecilia latipinna TaxID=48699 RepID=A0A3B3U1J4_9TELE
NKVGYFKRKRDVTEMERENQGKFIIIDFFYNNISCRLINIHAPNIGTHRKRFFLGLRQWIVTNCIIIGDFKRTLTKSDISNNCTFSEDYSRNTLFDIITQNSLVDIWRLFHPGKKQFTRKQVILGKLKQSRLDLLKPSVFLMPCFLPLCLVYIQFFNKGLHQDQLPFKSTPLPQRIIFCTDIFIDSDNHYYLLEIKDQNGNLRKKCNHKATTT